MDRIKTKIRDIPDFPKQGVIFKDITPLLLDAETLAFTINQLAAPFENANINAVVGMEARGFIFGSQVAAHLKVGFIPLRKPGKLPSSVKSIQYDLEYDQATLEVHTDAIKQGDRILIIDDVLATGGTAAASFKLIEQLGGTVIACGFVIELSFLQGRNQLNDIPIHSLVDY